VSVHFLLWAVIAMVAATVVLSVATTLVTLSLEHMRRARHAGEPDAEPWAGDQPPATTAEPAAEQGEILASHHYAADHDMYRPNRG